MADGVAIGIRANGDLEGSHRPSLILKDGNYRWWKATSAIPAIPAVVAAIGVAAIPGVAAIATNARITQARVDAFRVSHGQFAVNEVKTNSMILVMREKKAVMTRFQQLPENGRNWQPIMCLSRLRRE